MKKGSLRVCLNGHSYFKSSDCPTCPTCEAERRPSVGFLSSLAAPARRALEHHGIKSLKDLAKYKEQEILRLHGMGPASIPKLKDALSKANLTFKKP